MVLKNWKELDWYRKVIEYNSKTQYKYSFLIDGDPLSQLFFSFAPIN